jgi:hypothetical protein
LLRGVKPGKPFLLPARTVAPESGSLRADEKLTAFVEPESVICACDELS